MNRWMILVGAAVLALVFLRRPLRALGRLLARSGLGMLFLWLFQGVGGLLGIQLGINLFNSLTLGLLGIPGLALLLTVQWAIH